MFSKRNGDLLRTVRPLLVAALLLTAQASGTAIAQQSDGTPGVRLGDLTFAQAEARFETTPLVIVPFGAGAKEHGPHLPMNADLVVAEYLCDRAIEELPVVVAPAISHGWFPAFRTFPGTEIRDASVFQTYVLEVGRSLVRSGARRVVFLNTGIARATGLPISIAARELRAETGIPVLVVSWDDLEDERAEALLEQNGGGHADEGETSIHLFLQPELVGAELPGVAPSRDRGKPGPGYRPGAISRDPEDRDYLPKGYTGDPSLATAEKGRQLLEIMTELWLEALSAFSESPL